MAFTTLIDVRALRELQRAKPEGGLVVFDCRFDLRDPDAGRRAHAQGHVPGARYADLNRDLSGPVHAASGRHPLPAPAELAEFFALAGVRDTTQVVVYDAGNGSMAARAWWLLRWLGHTPVAVLDGGFRAWMAEGGTVATVGAPAAPTPAGRDAARFRAAPQLVALATADDVLAALGEPRRLLVDARAAERFAGNVEPLDAVAGHVPGAVNHPFSDNVGADERFLPPAVLRRQWSTRLGAVAPADVIHMCGSGVTACHNVLAMAAAGLPGSKLYAGSWSEWIRDPARPTAPPRIGRAAAAD